MTPYTYTCPCGLAYAVEPRETTLRRVWGTTTYAPRFEHTCPECDRTNYVHDGVVTMSLQAGKQRKALEGTP